MLLHKLANYSCNFEPTNARHAIIEQYELVHFCLAFFDFLNATLNQLYGSLLVERRIARIALSFEQLLHHKDVHVIVVYNKSWYISALTFRSNLFWCKHPILVIVLNAPVLHE